MYYNFCKTFSSYSGEYTGVAEPRAGKRAMALSLLLPLLT